MANPTCTRATLISGMSCLSGNLLSPHDKLVRRVYFDLLQLAAIGGTDYSADIPGMNVDANSLTCGFQPDNWSSAELVIASNNATAAGASVPSTKDTLATAVRCLDNYTDEQLKAMQLLLYCKLGRGKAYPQ